MTLQYIRPRARWLTISCLAVLLSIGGAQAPEARPTPVAPVFPPHSRPYGHSYGEWIAMSLEHQFGTVWDPESCTFGRIGNVELLQDNFGGTSTFECEVPAGTAFLVNVGTAFFLCPSDCGPGGAAPNGTPEEILAAARAAIDILPQLGFTIACEIDGVPVDNLTNYRAQSPVFYGENVPGSVFHAQAPDYYPPGPYGPAAADGFQVMVHPLPPGEHVIHFSAVIGTTFPEPLFETDVTHHITVVPGGRDSGEPLAVQLTTWGAIKAVYR